MRDLPMICQEENAKEIYELLKKKGSFYTAPSQKIIS
jgi:hypothetical protein